LKLKLWRLAGPLTAEVIFPTTNMKKSALLFYTLWITSSKTGATLVAPNALNLRIHADVTHEIPTTLYGYMWEVRILFGDNRSDSLTIHPFIQDINHRFGIVLNSDI